MNAPYCNNCFTLILSTGWQQLWVFPVVHGGLLLLQFTAMNWEFINMRNVSIDQAQTRFNLFRIVYKVVSQTQHFLLVFHHVLQNSIIYFYKPNIMTITKSVTRNMQSNICAIIEFTGQHFIFFCQIYTPCVYNNHVYNYPVQLKVYNVNLFFIFVLMEF